MDPDPDFPNPDQDPDLGKKVRYGSGSWTKPGSETLVRQLLPGSSSTNHGGEYLGGGVSIGRGGAGRVAHRPEITACNWQSWARFNFSASPRHKGICNVASQLAGLFFQWNTYWRDWLLYSIRINPFWGKMWGVGELICLKILFWWHSGEGKIMCAKLS